MRFLDEDTEYSFSPDRYEDPALGEIDYDVELIDTHDEIFDAMMGSGSCIEHEDEALQQGYVETFASEENVHFYRVGDKGYARAVEFDTGEGEALAVDAVKAGRDFDVEAYRAGINSIFRHAESMDKDVVVGGNMFFKHRWHKDLDLTRDQSESNPAHEVFFDEEVPVQELDVDLAQRPYDKGENWSRLNTFFVKGL